MLTYVNPNIAEWEGFLGSLEQGTLYEPKGFDEPSAVASLLQLKHELEQVIGCSIAGGTGCAVQDSAMLGILVLPSQFSIDGNTPRGIAFSKFGKLADLQESEITADVFQKLRETVEAHGYIPVPPQVLERISPKYGLTWRNRYLSWF